MFRQHSVNIFFAGSFNVQELEIKNERKKRKLNNEDAAKLVAAIQNHECLWDKKCKAFSNRNAIRNGWEEISKEVGMRGIYFD